MAENSLVTITRLLGGVVLMQGRLGHQVLGQLLVMNSNEVAVAAASVVVAGTTGQRSAVGQMALRTVAPALAVRALLKKQEERLERQAERLAGRERTLIERRIAIKEKNRRLRDRANRLAEKLRACEAAGAAPSAAPMARVPAALPPAMTVEPSPALPLEPSPAVPHEPDAGAPAPQVVTPRTQKTGKRKRSAADPRGATARASKPLQSRTPRARRTRNVRLKPDATSTKKR